ncbi:MAG: hypothetical protein Q8R92_15720 [Deltaproteobacteria bacterium]|nr:hypothetical protein [Deltaproteobacteria bacterium]
MMRHAAMTHWLARALLVSFAFTMGLLPAGRTLLHSAAHAGEATAHVAAVLGEPEFIHSEDDDHPQLHGNFPFHARFSAHVDLAGPVVSSQVELPRCGGATGFSSLESIKTWRMTPGDGVRAPPSA